MPSYPGHEDPVVSPDGAYIASVAASTLQIHHCRPLKSIRTIPIHGKPICHIKWSPPTTARSSFRFLRLTSDQACVWDLRDDTWSAIITNGSAGLGKIVAADFGCTQDELLLLSDFSSRLTVWSLSTARAVEIRNPKNIAHAFAHRPRSRHFAMISRPATQDFLSIHEPASYSVTKSLLLPTMDAHGLKWSPDGQWLIVWDSPTLSRTLYIFTADGNLYKTYTPANEAGELGVKSVEWSQDGQILAMSGHGTCVTLLRTSTVCLLFANDCADMVLTRRSFLQSFTCNIPPLSM